MGTDGQRIIGLFGDASRSARCGDYGQAALSVNSCVLEFQRLMGMPEGRSRLREYGPKMTYSLETLLLMIERKDWVAAADVIDYEFIPLWKEAWGGGRPPA